MLVQGRDLRLVILSGIAETTCARKLTENVQLGIGKSADWPLGQLLGLLVDLDALPPGKPYGGALARVYVSVGSMYQG